MLELEACPVCESPRIAHAYKARTLRRPDDGREWQVFRCQDCQHAFINPQPSWQELSHYYTADYDPYTVDHGSQDMRDAETVALAHKEGSFRHLPLPEGKRLLDVGCGGGWFLKIAKQLGAETFGIEPSAHGAERTRSSGIEVFNGSVSDYLEQNGDGRKFDIITANHVIEHSPDPVATFRQMRRLLAPGGLMWISVPNADGYFSRALGDDWHSSDLPYHLQQFCSQSLEAAVRKSGFDVRRQYTYSLPSGTASSLRAILRKKYMVPHRVSERLGVLNGLLARRYATWLDRKNDGEAIIGEYVSA
jgi:2-polyprenyl-3-methyl-5-hydroxy-6-metoxy-1,4-benzoquinol methylase